jgi:hypothetical protein
MGMDDSHLTRPCLESLSTEELIRLADRFGIDIPYGLERNFIIGELLGLDRNGAAETDADADTDGEAAVRYDCGETAALPKQYNISFIEALIRDPLWAFVFWEIKPHDRELYENAADFEGYCLRVVPLTDGKTEGHDSFTVPVGIYDAAWYLGFPPSTIRRYTVELCALRGSEAAALAATQPFTLPRLLEAEAQCGHASAPAAPAERAAVLARLSGASEFPVVRNTDRRSRARNDG